MNNIKFNYLKSFVAFFAIALTITSCERDISDEATIATYPKVGEVFTDNFVGMGSDFYFPYGGSKPTAWSVDNQTGYNSKSSMRIDVPNANDPEGTYAGAILRTDNAGRNLTDFDALTFWVKASQGVIIDELGFGEDFFPNKYITTLRSVSVGTAWTKIIIPIPDASKLVQERGMFRYAMGSLGTNSLGYTVWIDEIKFEKLGNIKLLNASILNGQNQTLNTYTGASQTINGLITTYNLANGQNVSVSTSPAYFNFKTSNASVATVSDKGVVNVVGLTGNCIVTASLGNTSASGSLSITTNGNFPQSPTPIHPAANVLSVFSNAYTNIVTPNFNPQFGGSTTVTTISTFNNNDIASYSSNNYTGIMFDNTPINASTRTFMHVDVFVPNGSTSVEFQIRDIGANQILNTDVNNGNPIVDDKDYRFTATGLIANQWNSINIPLAGNIATQKNNLGAIILVGGPNFILDNIYFFFP